MLLDNWMPDYDVAARYERVIAAPLAQVWRACLAARPDEHFIVRILFALRTRSFKRKSTHPMNERLSQSGFLLLEQRECEEIVRGIAGRFWTPSGGVVMLDSREAFLAFVTDGSAKSAMCLRTESVDPAHTRLITETRVQTFGDGARSSFRRYWRVIGPFSGLIRAIWLREIEKLATMDSRNT